MKGKKCKKCKGAGIAKIMTHYGFDFFKCLDCQGTGYHTLDTLTRLRLGRQITRLRQRYNINAYIFARLWGKTRHFATYVEYGFYDADYLRDLKKSVEGFCAILKKEYTYTIVQNPKNRKADFIEAHSSNNEELAKALFEDYKKDHTHTYQLIIQSQYIQPAF
jgi:ssDNA-binding Zn-finger/Zn-ribbon topoisomerase 1